MGRKKSPVLQSKRRREEGPGGCREILDVSFLALFSNPGPCLGISRAKWLQDAPNQSTCVLGYHARAGCQLLFSTEAAPEVPCEARAEKI